MLYHPKLRHAWSLRTAIGVGVVAGLIGLPASPVPAADYSVSVGYVDLLRPNPANFPTPWDGAPGVIFHGCPSCTLDAGAVRIVNNTGGALTVNAVIVRVDVCTFDLWPSNIAVPFGGTLIVTQTANGDIGCTGNRHFDTSEIGPGGVDWDGVCTPSKIIPQIDVTVNGVTTTYVDTGQVLNTGGIDASSCPQGTNESLQWTTIGSLPCPHAVLTLTASSQSHEVGTPVTLTATLTNSCGTPLGGVDVDFTSLGGPNGGTTYIATTDSSGTATLSYTSSHLGTDTFEALVTNLAGTITSTTNVPVTWTDPPSAPVAPTPASAPVAPAPQRGGGGGCTINPGAGFDPVVMGITALWLVSLRWKRVRKHPAERAGVPRVAAPKNGWRKQTT
jgi:hypothetical protein